MEPVQSASMPLQMYHQGLIEHLYQLRKGNLEGLVHACLAAKR